jgi:predicted RNA-binding protein YlxR (DUF448 family)
LLRSRGDWYLTIFEEQLNELGMSEQKNNRNKWLHLRLSEAEYKKIQNGFSKSTKRKISDYVRSILLNKPITVYTRSKSLDDFISEMILLRSELNSIGNNFNQSVKRLHTLDEISEINAWAILNEKSKEIFIKKVDEIKEKINQISDKWLQE